MHNTQSSPETDIHAPGGIQTRNPNKRAAADPRLRSRVRDARYGRLFALNYIQYFLTLVLFTFCTCCILRCIVCIVVSCLVCIVVVVLFVLL